MSDRGRHSKWPNQITAPKFHQNFSLFFMKNKVRKKLGAMIWFGQFEGRQFSRLSSEKMHLYVNHKLLVVYIIAYLKLLCYIICKYGYHISMYSIRPYNWTVSPPLFPSFVHNFGNYSKLWIFLGERKTSFRGMHGNRVFKQPIRSLENNCNIENEVLMKHWCDKQWSYNESTLLNIRVLSRFLDHLPHETLV